MSAVLTALAVPPDCAVIDANADAARLFDTTVPAIRGASLPDLLDKAGVLGPLHDIICDALVSNRACSARIHLPRNIARERP